jgi:hypothetical protein
MRRALAVLGLVPLSLAMSGCEPTSTTGAVYCTVIADFAYADKARQNIVAPAHFRCDQPGAATFDLTLALEKQQPDGTWRPLKSQGWQYRASQTTSETAKDARTASFTVPCADGVFRTSVSARWTGGGVSRTRAMQTRGTKNPCSGRFGVNR